MIGNRSISGRITWITLLVSTVALVIACVAFIAYDRYSVRQAMVRSLSSQAQIVGANSASAVTFSDPDSARATLSALGAIPYVRSAGILFPDGTMFAQYRRSEGAEVLDLPA